MMDNIPFGLFVKLIINKIMQRMNKYQTRGLRKDKTGLFRAKKL